MYKEKFWYMDRTLTIFYIEKISDKIYIKSFCLELVENTFIVCPESLIENNLIIQVSERPTKEMIERLEIYKKYQIEKVKKLFDWED